MNRGGPALLLDLAVCELACATVADLEKELGISVGTGEPRMLLVDLPARTKGVAAPRIKRIDPKFVPLTTGDWERDQETVEQFIARELAHGKAEVARFVKELHEAVAKYPGALAVRADRVRQQLVDDEREAFQAFVAAKRPLGGVLTLRAAAIL